MTLVKLHAFRRIVLDDLDVVSSGEPDVVEIPAEIEVVHGGRKMYGTANRTIYGPCEICVMRVRNNNGMFRMFHVKEGRQYLACSRSMRRNETTEFPQFILPIIESGESVILEADPEAVTWCVYDKWDSGVTRVQQVQQTIAIGGRRMIRV